MPLEFVSPEGSCVSSAAAGGGSGGQADSASQVSCLARPSSLCWCSAVLAWAERWRREAGGPLLLALGKPQAPLSSPAAGSGLGGGVVGSAAVGTVVVVVVVVVVAGGDGTAGAACPGEPTHGPTAPV